MCLLIENNIPICLEKGLIDSMHTYISKIVYIWTFYIYKEIILPKLYHKQRK